MSRRFARFTLGAVLGISAIGCAPKPKPSVPTIYTGPTLPLDQLLAAINRNNDRIRTLNANGPFQVSMPGEGELNGTLNLLYTKPDSLRIRAEKDVFGLIFDLGTDGKRFWMFAKGKTITTWYGTNFGPAETNPTLPIPPQLLTEVLGVGTLNLDLLAQPIPTMRFNPDYDSYMLTWHQPLKDRWVTLREIWYDRQTFEPRRLWLFDRDGRVLLRAKLDQFEPMSRFTSDVPDAPAPKTARRYEVFFPETGAKLQFTLDDVRDQRRGAPNAFSYRFNPQAQETDRIINLDEAPTGAPPR